MNVGEGKSPLPSNLEHITSVDSSVMSVSSITDSVNSPEPKQKAKKAQPERKDSKFKPAED